MDDASTFGHMIENIRVQNFHVWKQKVEILLALREQKTYTSPDGTPPRAFDDDKRFEWKIKI